MAIGATSTQTVIINVVVRSGNATQMLNQLGQGGKKAHTAFDQLNAGLGNFAKTLSKALISMAGVLVAFNLFVTLPQMAVKGVFALTAAIIKYGESLQETIIQTAGLLSSFASFGPNLEDSFNNAIKVSTKLQFRLAELAAESVATGEDMQKAFQVFVARGGLEYSGGDIDKAAKTAALLTNITIAFTGTLQKERQIYTEIDAMMQGQARAGAVVARLLKSQVGDLKTYLAQRKQEGNLLEDLQRRFGGVVMASQAMGNTLTGMWEAITGSAKILNNMAFRGGAFETIAGILKEWRNAFTDSISELGRLGDGVGPMTETTKNMLKGFVELNVAVTILVVSVNELLSTLTGETETTAIFEKLADWSARATIAIGLLAREVGHLFKFEPGLLSGGFYKSIMATAAEYRARVLLATEKVKQSLAGGDEDSKNLKGMLHAQEISEELAKAIEKANKHLRTMQSELALLLVANDDILKIQTAQQIKAEDLAIEYAKTPAILSQMLIVHQQITNELIKQAQAKVLDKFASVREDIELAAASTNDYTEANVKLSHALAAAGKTLGTTDKVVISGYQNWLRAATAAELYAGIQAELKDLYFNEVETQLGRIARLEEERLDNVTAILGMNKLDIKDRLMLVNAINEQYKKTKDLHTLDLTKNLGREIGEMEIALARVTKDQSAIRDIETERLEKARQLTETYHEIGPLLEYALSVNDKIADAKKRQAEFESMLNEGKSAQSYTRSLQSELQDLYLSLELVAFGFGSWGQSMDGVRTKLKEIGESVAMNNIHLIMYREILKTLDPGSENYKDLQAVIASLQQTNLQASESAMKLYDDLATVASNVPGVVAEFQRMFVAIDMTKDKVMAFRFAMRMIGTAIGQAFGEMIAGTASFGQALKRMLGEVVKAFADFVMAKGIAMMAAGAWPFNPALIAQGLAIVAIAGTLYGLASMLGGSGSAASAGGAEQSAGASSTPKTEPYYIDNQNVAAQQGIQYAMGENTRAIMNLNGELSRLSKEQGDVLVARTVRENPKVVLDPIVSKIGNSYTYQQKFSGVVRG